jgi:hypothetical protein
MRRKRKKTLTCLPKELRVFYAVKHNTEPIYYVDAGTCRRTPYTMPREIAVALKRELSAKFFARFKIVKLDKHGKLLRSN